jgi:hypothetical protein
VGAIELAEGEELYSNILSQDFARLRSASPNGRVAHRFLKSSHSTGRPLLLVTTLVQTVEALGVVSKNDADLCQGSSIGRRLNQAIR